MRPATHSAGRYVPELSVVVMGEAVYGVHVYYWN